MLEIRFLILQGKRGPPSGGKTTLLGGWHGHLLVTPALHDAVQKANEIVGILEVSEIYGQIIANLKNLSRKFLKFRLFSEILGFKWIYNKERDT